MLAVSPWTLIASYEEMVLFVNIPPQIDCPLPPPFLRPSGRVLSFLLSFTRQQNLFFSFLLVFTGIAAENELPQLRDETPWMPFPAS